MKLIIKEKDDEINSLKNKLRPYEPNINDNSYNNFDINLKKPKYHLKYHTKCIRCSTVLNDGRIATGSLDNSIVIYNNKTFKADLTIKELSNSVFSLIQLNLVY